MSLEWSSLTPEEISNDLKTLNNKPFAYFWEVMKAFKWEKTDTNLWELVWSKIDNIKAMSDEQASQNLFVNILNSLLPKSKFGDFVRELLNISDSSSQERKKLSLDVSSNSIVWLDLRSKIEEYPNDAGVKNNNPWGLSISNAFEKTLRNAWIPFEKWTDRPFNETGKYFRFPNVQAWMQAFNKLWDIKLRNFSDGTVADIVKSWAVDFSSYEEKLWEYWNSSVSSLTESDINTIQMTQIQIESPGFYKESHSHWFSSQIERRNFT